MATIVDIGNLDAEATIALSTTEQDVTLRIKGGSANLHPQRRVALLSSESDWLIAESSSFRLVPANTVYPLLVTAPSKAIKVKSSSGTPDLIVNVQE